MNVIADTSFLFSVTSAKDRSHVACVDVLKKLRPPVLVPSTVLTEVTYLLATKRNHQTMRQFIRGMQPPAWHIATLEPADILRSWEILEQYQDSELDFADATIVAIAERLKITTVLTLDQRDFRMIRPKHTPYFNILPE